MLTTVICIYFESRINKYFANPSKFFKPGLIKSIIRQLFAIQLDFTSLARAVIKIRAILVKNYLGD